MTKLIKHRKFIFANIMLLVFSFFFTPNVANAAETQSENGIMKLSLQENTNSATTGDFGFLPLFLIFLVSLTFYIVIRYRFVFSNGWSKEFSIKNNTKLIIAAIFILIASVSFVLLSNRASATNDNLKNLSTSSIVEVDADGKVLDNNLCITNSFDYDISIENVIAPDKLQGWSSGVSQGTKVTAGNEINQSWNVQTIPSDLLEQLRQSKIIELDYTVIYSKTTIPIDFKNDLKVDDSDEVYNGNKIIKSVESSSLIKDVDYTVTYGENVNAGTGTVTIKGIGKYTGEKTYTFNIYQAQVTITGINATDKTYDGTTGASLDYKDVEFGGLYEGDSLAVSATGEFVDKNAGDDKTVNISNLKLGGDSVGNYKLSAIGQQTTASATISPKVVTLTWQSNISLIYNKKAQVPNANANELVTGENVDVEVEGAGVNVGDYTALATRLLNPSTHEEDSNYKLPSDSSTSQEFSITQAEIAISGIKANKKTYDGTTGATLDYKDVEFSGLYEGDSLTISATGEFVDKNAGDDKTVNIDDLVLDGVSIDNYKLAEGGQQTSTKSKIDPIIVKVVWSSTISFPYDKTEHVPSASAEGMIGEEKLNVVISGAKIDAGNNYEATASDLVNPDTKLKDSNYKLPSDSSTSQDFSITKADITISGLKANEKTYDGTKDATLDYKDVVFSGLYEGDSLTVSATGEFIDKNVGEDKTVNISNLKLGGDSESNYKLSDQEQQQKSTTANIVPCPLALTWGQQIEFEYDGKTHNPSVTIDEKSIVVGDTVNLSISDPKTDVGSYTATVTIDNSNYSLKGTTSQSFSIIQATPQYVIPSNLVSEQGKTLSSITIPEQTTPQKGTFSWKDSTIYIKEAGDKQFKATFTPEDTHNYKTVENIDIPVKVSQVAYAFYSEDDFSLDFYKRDVLPDVGGKSNDKTVTQLYLGIERDTYTSATIPWVSFISAIKSTQVVDVIYPVSTAFWFNNCTSIESINISNLYTTKNISMQSMFQGCTTLSSISLWDEFKPCANCVLTDMFANDASLTTIKHENDWTTVTLGDTTNMFNGCVKLPNFDSAKLDFTYAYPSNGHNGYFESRAYTNYNNGVLTFYFDDYKQTRTGENFTMNYTKSEPGWGKYSSSIDSVVIDSSFKNYRPQSCYGWFGTFTSDKLTSLDLTNLNTSEVICMDYMFGFPDKEEKYGSSGNIETINFGSTFDTHNVKTMASMFDQCKKLTSLDLSSWDTSSLTVTEAMFACCHQLTDLNLKNWKTTNLYNMAAMFWECYVIKKIDLSSFDVSNVNNTPYTTGGKFGLQKCFWQCKVLEEVIFGNHYKSDVDTTQMTYECPETLKITFLDEKIQATKQQKI